MLTGTVVMASNTGRPQSIDSDAKQYVRRLLLAMQPFQELRHDMPLQYVMTFLLVAEEEGLGITEYAKRADVAQSVMSRHILDLGDRDRKKAEGFGLVHTSVDPMELRKKRVYLTDKGRVIWRRMQRAIER